MRTKLTVGGSVTVTNPEENKFKLEESCVNCGKLGTQQPQLHIWAQGRKKQHDPAIAAYGVLVCADCKLDTEMETLAIEAFRQVCKATGKSPPGYYETVYVPLGDSRIFDGSSNIT